MLFDQINEVKILKNASGHKNQSIFMCMPYCLSVHGYILNIMDLITR